MKNLVVTLVTKILNITVTTAAAAAAIVTYCFIP
jgi:hypothetical protein